MAEQPSARKIANALRVLTDERKAELWDLYVAKPKPPGITYSVLHTVLGRAMAGKDLPDDVIPRVARRSGGAATPKVSMTEAVVNAITADGGASLEELAVLVGGEPYNHKKPEVCVKRILSRLRRGKGSRTEFVDRVVVEDGRATVKP